MSQDQSRVQELQSALRTKMADNKSIADSFKVEDGTVVVSTEQKSAFDKNMADIREIKGLIEGLESMNEVSSWSQSSDSTSVASAHAAAAQDIKQYSSQEIKSLGQKNDNLLI